MVEVEKSSNELVHVGVVPVSEERIQRLRARAADAGDADTVLECVAGLAALNVLERIARALDKMGNERAPKKERCPHEVQGELWDSTWNDSPAKLIGYCGRCRRLKVVAVDEGSSPQRARR